MYFACLPACLPGQFFSPLSLRNLTVSTVRRVQIISHGSYSVDVGMFQVVQGEENGKSRGKEEIGEDGEIGRGRTWIGRRWRI